MKEYAFVICLLVLVICIIICGLCMKKHGVFESFTSSYSIPKNIFQTWHTHALSPKMQKCVDKVKKANPEFKYYLFDDDQCQTFIKDNFEESVINAYNILIPSAYKADLWRYCVLYKYGGIYLDIKYKPIKGFKFINLIDNEHYVRDMDGIGIYNAFMVCNRHNMYLYEAIQKIVENVKNKFMGKNFLEPTGPRMLATIIPKSCPLVDYRHYFVDNLNNRFIEDKKTRKRILKSYDGYINEYNTYKKSDHYSVLWKHNKIYKE